MFAKTTTIADRSCPQRLLLFRNGRAEVIFPDGSAAILHPPDAARTSYFRPDGQRLRFLTALAPNRNQQRPKGGQGAVVVDEVRCKIEAAASLRARFCVAGPFDTIPRITVTSSTQRAWRYARISEIRWPVQPMLGDPASYPLCPIVVNSVDGVASLTLASHGQTYITKHWCALEDACHVDSEAKLSDGEHVAKEAAQSNSSDRHSLDFTPRLRRFELADGSAVANIRYEHALVTQCHAVGEQPCPVWGYPLLLALHVRREHLLAEGTITDVDLQIEAVAVAVDKHFLEGSIVNVGTGEVVASLASLRAISSHGLTSDAISPAATLGAGASEGAVSLLWDSGCTKWIQECGECTIVLGADEVVRAGAFNSSETQFSTVLVSSQGGQFWRQLGSCGETIEIYCSAVVPVDRDSAPIATNIQEALKWLRYNSIEERISLLAPQRSSVTPSFSFAAAPFEVSAAGWVMEKDVVQDEIGRLSVFRAVGALANTAERIDERRLVRVQFVDAARLEFMTRVGPPQDSMLGCLGGRNSRLLVPEAGDCFRLLTPQGEVVLRSFGLALGYEKYARLACAMLRNLAVDPVEEHEATTRSALIAELAFRRCEGLLLRHGGTSLACHIGVGIDKQAVASEDIRPIKQFDVADALLRSRKACLEIEGVLARKML